MVNIKEKTEYMLDVIMHNLYIKDNKSVGQIERLLTDKFDNILMNKKTIEQKLKGMNILKAIPKIRSNDEEKIEKKLNFNQKLKFSPLREFYLNDDFAGVYVIIKGEEIIYIGQSSQVKKRVNRHILMNSSECSAWISKVSYMTEVDRIRIERELIKKFKPSFNKEFNRE